MSTDQTPPPNPVVMLEADHALLKDPGPVDTITLIAKGGILLTQQEWDRKPPEPPTAEELYAALVSKLHEKCIHPDYQYESVEHQRKTCADSNPPEGEGWEVNFDYDRGYTRYDYTEDHHWRRLKSYKLTDEPEAHALPSLVMDKLDLAHCRALFYQVLSANHALSAFTEQGVLLPDSLVALGKRPTTTVLGSEAELDGKSEATGFFGIEEKTYLVLTSPLVRVLMNMIDNSFQYQCRLGNGKWGARRDWDSDYLKLPIDGLRITMLFEMGDTTCLSIGS